MNTANENNNIHTKIYESIYNIAYTPFKMTKKWLGCYSVYNNTANPIIHSILRLYLEESCLASLYINSGFCEYDYIPQIAIDLSKKLGINVYKVTKTALKCLGLNEPIRSKEMYQTESDALQLGYRILDLGVVTPIVEEVIFRGLIQQGCLRYLPKKIIARVFGDDLSIKIVESKAAKISRVVITAALFALAHQKSCRVGGNISILISSLALGAMTESSNSILNSIVSHMVRNNFKLACLHNNTLGMTLVKSMSIWDGLAKRLLA